MAKSLQQINLEFNRESGFERGLAALPRFSDILRAAFSEFRYRGKAELEMGGVVWRVLATEDEAVLLISKEILGRRKFHGASPFCGWNESEIRAYLNGAFYDRFPAEARALIPAVANDTATDCEGERVSRDRIFLLSLDEARDGRYFADAEDRIALYGGEGPWWWWLRCCGAGIDANAAVNDTVAAVDKNGIFNRAYTDLEMGGVRPALWMRLGGGA
ncbi:MAG: DUF6273 domain-containing protein [Clostridiales Family XIII bacterium]|jgi:hypothetical protein|nr:DUF6273 domain-containing protein [Clostridiales Family XIII bacterium]